jgi:hypothetical protein
MRNNSVLEPPSRTNAYLVLLVTVLVTSCSAGRPVTQTQLAYGPVQLSQNSFVLAGCGRPNSARFIASQSNYAGVFRAVSADTNLAQVTLTSGPGTFLVKQTGTPFPAATTTITVTGGGGGQATAQVTVGFHICPS